MVVACENDGSSGDDRDALPEIARVDKIRLDGRLNITWTYHPSHASVPPGPEHGRYGPFELLISDHKSTIVSKVLTGLVDVKEFCGDCLKAESWCWASQFQTYRKRVRPAPKPRRHEEAS